MGHLFIMYYPDGLSAEDAEKIINDANSRILIGEEISNIYTAIYRCDKCGRQTPFESRYCAFCSIANIELQPKNTWLSIIMNSYCWAISISIIMVIIYDIFF